MKKSIRLLLTAFCFALAASNQVYSQNLVINPGFEDPVGTEWTWVKDDALGSDPTINTRYTSATNHSGNYVYRIAYIDPNPGSIAAGSGHIVQTISNLTAGAAYTVSGWVMLYFRTDRNWAYIEAQGGGNPVLGPAKGANPMYSNAGGLWTNIVLTQTARLDGTLDVLLHLDHYATTVNGKDNGCFFDDISVTLAPPPPLQISSISGAGTASVTVNYTNTFAGTNYVLQYATNLNSPTTWLDLSTNSAPGDSDSQTDTTANGQERYYRVYYVTQ